MDDYGDTPNLDVMGSLPKDLAFRAEYTPDDGAEVSHLGFLAWVVSQVSPAQVVQLGQGAGAAYFAVCQAMQALGLVDTRSYAIDLGSNGSGSHQPSAQAYNQAHYQDFSSLISLGMADALARFEDASIDLLLWSDVSPADASWQALQAWLPKLSPKGLVVLLGGPSAGWVDAPGIPLKQQFPCTLVLASGHGLIAFAPDASQGLYPWLRAGTSLQAWVQSYFEMQDRLACASTQLDLKSAQLQELQAEALSTKQALQQRESSLNELRHSRSWRITQPLRGATAFFQRQQARGSVLALAAIKIQHVWRTLGWGFSRLLSALALLPATFFQYRPFSQWIQALRGGKSFFGNVMRNPAPALQRLSHRPRILRVFVSAGISFAQKLAAHGGCWAILKAAFEVIRREGLGGVRVRLLARVPEADLVVAHTPLHPKNILVLDHAIPMADMSAGDRATAGILKDLAGLGFDVTFLPANLSPAPHYQQQIESLGVRVITRDQGVSSLTQYLAGQGHDFGVFYLIRMDAAQSVLDLIRQVAPGAQLIFHAPDLHFLRESREAELSGDPAQAQAAQQTQARELALMRTVDHVIVVSPVEKDLLEIQAPDVPVSVFPALYADVADQVPGFDARQHIFFLGGFDHRPNQQAVLWFAQEIWPLVQARLPGVEFHILGARPTADIKALSSVPGVKVCGHISQLDATLAKLRLGVAPLQFGAGIKGKVATTLGAGIPCICTTIAAEGMHLRDGIDVLLADTAADFADAVVQAYTNQDIWQRLSSQGRLRIEHYFSQQANTCDLVTVLDAAHALPLDLYVQHCERLHSLPVPVADQSPVVSIIVVACNQWNLTRICLNAILMTCKNQDLPFEIILADDASIDETRDAAAHYIGLRVARTPFRMGYAGNCNHAAQLARGSLLIMISQEMVVLPGWLAPLVDVLDQHPDAVMAGAKALYLDGSIRNAGRHLFSDGTSIAAGRGLRRDTAVFNTIREIDTVDGGLKIVRRDFWQQACLSSRVGFSTYWQDVDLDQCAQAFGKTILYQPQAEAVCQDAEYYATLLARPVPVVPPEGPLVSIIIPVYNQWQVTRACINSVLETCSGDPVSYELILADDCSTDDTAHACEQYPGLIVSRTAHNVGFLRNCNQAAKLAQGQYILLLNNDTIVLPGWLDMLVQTLDHNPDVAIAGSKILYVDGKIQEAGAHLFTDATAMNAGRSQDRTAPLLNLPREVDYISGCSVLVRRSFWEQISGFDERYRTAYCEDSDLAMTARSLGFKVLYQPGSEIVHYEHQSYSHQKESSRKLQAHNIALLREKWHDVLLHDHLPASAMPYQVIAHSQRHPLQTTLTKRQNQGLDILYFSPFPSHPASHGNRSTINEFAHHFQRLGHRVHFVLLKYADQYTPEDAQAMREAWDTFDLIPFGRTMQIYPGGIPYDAWYEDGLGETIQTLCARYDIDMVFCSYVFQSKMLEYVPDYLLKVIDTHDKMGNRYEMLRQNGQPLEFFSCTPAEEGAYLRRADVVVARRKQEADYFDEQMGCQHSIVIPHVEPPRFIQRSFPVLRQVGVVASANRINLAIVLECLQAIDRRLGTQTPSFTLHIAGHVNEMIKDLPAADQLVFRRPWVVLHGFVDSIQDFYTSLDLVLSPVTMGTGINVKTVQAMAFGMPLLTTSWGAKGIETGHPMHEHADMDALAASLISLAQDPSDALQVLADTSRQRYQQFYEESMQGFNTLLAHPKLLPLDSHSNTQALS